MYYKGSIIHTAAGFEPFTFRSLAPTTMPSKLTQRFRLLQHELILTSFSKEQNHFTQRMQETGIQQPRSHCSARWPSKTSLAKVIQAMLPHLRSQESLQGAERNHGHHHHWPFQNLCKAPVSSPCPSGPSPTPSCHKL